MDGKLNDAIIYYNNYSLTYEKCREHIGVAVTLTCKVAKNKSTVSKAL